MDHPNRSVSLRAAIVALLTALCLMAAAGPAACAERVSVKTATANIRSAPDNKAIQLWQIEKYHPLLVLETKGDWLRVKDFEGDQGWIHKDLVDKAPSVITKSDNCNVRSGPGTEHDIVFTVNKGIPFKVLQKKDHWLEVQHADGDKGWIFDVLVW